MPVLIVLFLTTVSIYNLDEISATDSASTVLSKVIWLRLLLFMPLFVDTSGIYSFRAIRFLVAQQYVLASVAFLFLKKGNDEMSMPNQLLQFGRAGFSNPAIRTLSCDWVIKIAGDVSFMLVG
jgi:hypothetical protein